MPPTAPKIVGDAGSSYNWGIDDNTVISFLNIESQEVGSGSQKNEILDQKGNVIAIGFSRNGEKVISFSGLLKGTVPEVGDTLDVQHATSGSSVTGVIQEDLKIGESNNGWRNVSFTLGIYPDMAFTP